MQPYRIQYYIQGVYDYKILQAYSPEDAIKKADVDPKAVYQVWTLKEWFNWCERIDKKTK